MSAPRIPRGNPNVTKQMAARAQAPAPGLPKNPQGSRQGNSPVPSGRGSGGNSGGK